jgi:glycine/D-amino acid oxidase-like deaminating enzyme
MFCSFDLFTHTPCTDVKTSDEDDLDQYIVETPRGAIRARHIVHATNGWVSHLLPGMRGKVFPARGVMTAQIPRGGLGDVPEAGYNKREESEEPKEAMSTTNRASWTGTRSFVFYPSTSVGVYDYLTQQLPSGGSSRSSYPSPNGELMLGGGFAHGAVADIGNADDSECSPAVGEYVRQALGSYFSVKRNGEKEGKDEVKATWSGILGISADERPWVGRIPVSITARGRQTASGEWIAAGYTGEGMVHAWMSGKALGHMVLGVELDSWLPEVFMVTEERWRSAGFESFVCRIR